MMKSADIGIKAELILDHLILGVPNLDQGIEWVREQTGVAAVLGGRHPGAGTHNALLSLGERQYMELIALDPTQTGSSYLALLLQNLGTPRLITWAAATADIQLTAQLAATRQFQSAALAEGSRVQSNGLTLKWKTLHIQSGYGAMLPFFIEWDAGALHPSRSSPLAGRLVSFEIRHPQADQIREILLGLGIAASVVHDDTPRLRAVLSTAGGRVVVF